MEKPALNDLRRLVIKIGSSLLIDTDNKLNRDWLDGLAKDIAALQTLPRFVLAGTRFLLFRQVLSA